MQHVGTIQYLRIFARGLVQAAVVLDLHRATARVSVRLKELLSLPEADAPRLQQRSWTLSLAVMPTTRSNLPGLNWRARASTTGQALDADAHLADLESRYG